MQECRNRWQLLQGITSYSNSWNILRSIQQSPLKDSSNPKLYQKESRGDLIWMRLVEPYLLGIFQVLLQKSLWQCVATWKGGMFCCGRSKSPSILTSKSIPQRGHHAIQLRNSQWSGQYSFQVEQMYHLKSRKQSCILGLSRATSRVTQ